jgi:NADH dehydrogenase
MAVTPQRKPQLVIVGAGFGGVRLARKLQGRSDLDVTLISSSDHFAYYPQLYHTASGGARTESYIPLTNMVDPDELKLVKDTITKLDPEAKTVTGTFGTAYQYDELVLALGAVTNYFGIQGLEEYAYNIKSISGAEKFKRHLHQDLIDDMKPDVNFVVVGGGPTGVELVAALPDYLRRITHLHRVPTPKYSIKLIEAAPRLLPRSTEHMSAVVQHRLEELGVEVMTGQTVKAETATALELAGEKITTQTVVWTAGVANHPFFKDHASLFTLAKNGKVEVNEHLEGRPGVRVIGDNASTQYSGMAQTALHDADYVAADIVRALQRRSRPAYKPKAPIAVTPVGPYWAAAQWGEFEIYGLAGFGLRRAADLIGYADLESWPRAFLLWLDDNRRQDDCTICQPGIAPAPPLPAN